MPPDRGCGVGEHEVGPEQQRLLPGSLCERGAADPAFEAEIVADQGTGAGLTTDRDRLHDQGAQPLRCSIHRSREAGRPGADHGEVVELRTGVGLDTVCRGELAERRVVQDCPVVADGGGQRLDVDPQLADEPGAGLRFELVELERHAVASHDVAQFVAARVPLLADDPIDDVVRTVHHCPGGQRLLDLRVQPLLGSHPPFGDVDVEASQRHGPPQGGQLGERDPGLVLVHGHEQDADTAPVARLRPLQQLQRVHAVEMEVDSDQRELLPRSGGSLHDLECRRRIADGDDAVVRAEPPNQCPFHRDPRRGVAVDYEHQRADRARTAVVTIHRAASSSRLHRNPRRVQSPCRHLILDPGRSPP